MKDRAQWQKSSYAKYWADRVRQYGFDAYCQGLCRLVESKKPARVYELAIGTGWPFAASFREKGFEVAGSDIAPLLIEELKARDPAIDARVASYEDIDTSVAPYDVVYCFRSTWYFPDLFRALDTMIALTRQGGAMMFDIMNADSETVRRTIRGHRLKFPLTIAKNTIKRAANALLGRSYLPQDPWSIHELPASAARVEEYLKSRGMSYQKYSINQITDGLDRPFSTAGGADSKVVFVCTV